jgi:hypothetical protein
VPRLVFPAHEIVGTLRWEDSTDGVDKVALATGVVVVPERVEVTLKASWMESVRAGDTLGAVPTKPGEGSKAADLLHDNTGSGSGRITEPGPMNLRFLSQLPADSITTLQLDFSVAPESFSAVTHLAAGLRWLYLGWTGLDDAALGSVAQLRRLVYLQTWGNRFTDGGVQQLAALQNLEALYLEEKSLSARAFEFASHLPQLARLGIKDVPMSADERSRLKAELPGVDVG